MSRDDVLKVVFEELGNIAPEAALDTVDPDADLREEIDIDSMDFLNFVIALHKRLKVEIPESDYGKLVTINDVVGYLSTKVAT